MRVLVMHKFEVKCAIICDLKNRIHFFSLQRYDQDGKTDGSETVANQNHKLYYHYIGESQDQDILVAEFPEHPAWTV